MVPTADVPFYDMMGRPVSAHKVEAARLWGVPLLADVPETRRQVGLEHLAKLFQALKRPPVTPAFHGRLGLGLGV